MSKVFALIDCNNFFVSCERLFRPGLEGKPVVVLSSNDACVVARSNEAKDAGVPMGAPMFKHREIFQRNKIVTMSANFEIYGDISKRITALLATVTPRIEIYSVDESFLDLSSLPITDYAAWGNTVRKSIFKNIGVPVSIGVAPTKTLAKLASEIAKQHARRGTDDDGAVSFVGIPETARKALLAEVPVGKVWGVGWRLAPKLRAEGVGTALALSQLRPQRAQQLMGINGRKLVAELNGVSCHQLELEGKLAQSIMRSRTFGEDTNQVHVIEAATASMSARAAFTLRREGLLAKKIGVFTETSRHKPGYRQWSRTLAPATPTNDTGIITSLLVHELHSFFSNKQLYHRLGVYLFDFIPVSSLQIDLLGRVSATQHDKSRSRMAAVDSINVKYGRGRIRYASEDLSRAWRPKQDGRSPCYLSNWDELPEARVR